MSRLPFPCLLWEAGHCPKATQPAKGGCLVCCWDNGFGTALLKNNSVYNLPILSSLGNVKLLAQSYTHCHNLILEDFLHSQKKRASSNRHCPSPALALGNH